MKRESKQTYTYATRPSLKEKASRKAIKEGSTLSEKINEWIEWYIANGDSTVYFDSIGRLLVQESNKKKK